MQFSRREVLGGLFALTTTPANTKRPNIIVIVTDDQGYSDTGFNGSRDFDTPHIDRLAASGVRLRQGYVSHPYCSPSRAGLLTGRYQQRFGHEHNPAWAPDNENIGMDSKERTVANQLRDAGYATGWIGKWHLGAAARFHPLRRGFQETFGFLGGGHKYYQWSGSSSREALQPIERNGQPVQEAEYLTDAFTREAVSFIERHSSDPFFLYLAYNAPHSPNQAPQRYLDRAPNIMYPHRAIYAAMMAAVDDGIGRILQALDAKGVRGNTLIFFLSDNGGRADGADNRPLRGFKGMLHEGGIRVPFLVSWPDILPANHEFDYPVIALDIMPTAVAAAGAKPPSLPLDGVDLTPYLLGRRSGPPHHTLFWRTAGGKGYAVRHGRFKLVKDIPMSQPQVFDLETDSRESTDLAQVHPEVLKDLQTRYERWNSTLAHPRWTENHEENIRRDYNALEEARTRALPPDSRTQ